ncbi:MULTISPECIES: TIGR03943 family protein [unclassified Streptomyces]|uniref:TIGR03943 family putative permease subunit n=1 Tax=unclassified Streptomyces TaxID=2593676 RepID=UPI000F4E7162|nr:MULTISPECIES: TIGR03943 family protein [unclassified Streptomyces]MDH6451798.1 putative repeat protein (TIGR03943 family) [Streptomyces sp. SAI-119]MDH6497645.1 putative repeat protein (TIGR03943 family) [Streptomyces sp. SAI-149]
MNRQAQSAVLFVLGAALLHAGLTDLYLRYVKAGLRPLVLAAGVVLIATALATAWYEWRARAGQKKRHAEERAGDHVEEHVEEHAGEHAHREPRVSWLLVLPLFALILVAPPALGSYSAMRTGTALQQSYGYTKLPESGPLRLGLADYAGRAVYEHGRGLAGRQIVITGFVALDHSGAPYLVRMALNCCAADAQPVKVGLTGRIPPVLKPDGWLQVTGTYTAKRTKDTVNGGPIPYLDVTEAKPVATPHDPYDETWNN